MSGPSDFYYLLTYFIWFISLTTKTHFPLGQEFPRSILEKVVDTNLLISTFTSAQRKNKKSRYGPKITFTEIGLEAQLWSLQPRYSVDCFLCKLELCQCLLA